MFSPAETSRSKADGMSATTLRLGRSAGGSVFGSPTSTHASVMGDHQMAAVIENRGGEVGIAVLNLATLQLSLTQFTDSVSFAKTISFLHSQLPACIVVPHTAQTDNVLLQMLLQSNEDATITSIHRRYFNESTGANRVFDLSASSDRLAEITDVSRYLSLASAAAILQYSEVSLACTLVPNTLRIKSVTLSSFVDLHRKSAVNLGVVPPLRFNGATLIERANFTVSPGGARLFRSNLLQPLRDVPTLTHRLDAVDYLLAHPHILQGAVECLRGFKDIDFERTIATFSKEPDATTLSIVQNVVDAIISLKHALGRVGRLETLLGECECPLLVTIHNAVELSEAHVLADIIAEHLDEGVIAATSEVGQHRAKGAMVVAQQCFAIRTSGNNLLAVSRKKFSELLEEIFTHAEFLRATYSCKGLKITFTPKRGYVVSVASFQAQSLPRELMLGCTFSGKSVTFVTAELSSLNVALLENVEEMLACHQQAVSDLLVPVRRRMGGLQALAEAVALLDLTVSHARLALGWPFHCRPVFDGDSFSLTNGVLPTAFQLHTQQPNSVSFPPTGGGLLLLSGPNASGKSTCIQMIAQLTVLALMGARVPASGFEIRPPDAILALCPAQDAIEASSSSFVFEMRQLASLSHSVTRHTLVLLDELGRGTSGTEGNAIAWATSEWLVDAGCRCVFASHSAVLPALATNHPSLVSCAHFKVTVDDSDGATLHYTFQLAPGPCELDEYGLKVVRLLAGRKPFVEKIERLLLGGTPSTAATASNPWM